MIYPVAGQRGTLDPNAEPFVYATATATAAVPGTHSIVWNTRRDSGFQLDFFGLTDAPGTGFTVIGDPIVSDPFPPPPPVLPDLPPPTGGSVPGSGGTPFPPANHGGGHTSDPIPEPSAALLFALGVACVRRSMRRSRIG